jgi:signal transduction histidine kinase
MRIAESGVVLAKLLELLTQPDPMDWQAVLDCVLTGIRSPEGSLVTAAGVVLASSGQPPVAASWRQRLPLRCSGITYGYLCSNVADIPHDAPSIAAALGLALRSVALEQQSADFLSAVTHDVRGGLGRTSGFVQLLQQKAAAYPELVELAGLTSTHLADTELLLRELSAYAHSGRKHSQVSKSSVTAIFDTVAYLTRRRCESSGATLVLEPTEAVVAASEDTVVQLLIRVIDNSLKFAGDHPQVRLSAQRLPATVLIRVEDSGPLFDPAHAETIFIPFQRLHSKRFPGHGLGLAIARRTITSLGGTIVAEPATPSGLAILVELPSEPLPERR